MWNHRSRCLSSDDTQCQMKCSVQSECTNCHFYSSYWDTVFKKISWVFIVADWLPNPWWTSLFPLAVATVTLDFRQGKCLDCLLQPSASKKEQTNSFAFCPWDMALHCLYIKLIYSETLIKDQSTSCQGLSKYNSSMTNC